MAKVYECPRCGFVHEDDTPPPICMICKLPGDQFVAKEE